MSTPYTFTNLKSFINSQTHSTKSNWPNFDNTIAINCEDWGEEDIKEFAVLVENSKKPKNPLVKS